MPEADLDLSARMSRLAAAVPVSDARLDRAHRDAVRARQQVRMAWLTPLVVIVIGTVWSFAFRVGPFATGATPEPSSSRTPSSSSVGDGDFELSIEPAKSTFSTAETLDVKASLVYRGSAEHVTVFSSWWGPLTFRAPGARGVTLLRDAVRACTEIDLARDIPYVARLLDLRGDPQPFSLPHGLYEISVAAAFDLGTCTGGTLQLGTSTVIAVSSGGPDIPIWTDHDPAGVCPLNRAGGVLVLDSTNGLGISQNGTIRGGIWPPGYSARAASGGAALVNNNGAVAARVGDHLVFSGGFGDGLIKPCGGIRVVHPEIPDGPVDLATTAPLNGDTGLGICPTAIGGGMLVPSPRTGLGFGDWDGVLERDVVWPAGYSAAWQSGELILFGPGGSYVAAVGDWMTAGGGYTKDGTWFACSSIEQVAQPPRS